MMEEIYVTKPALPPLEELFPYLERIWKTRTLTNGGPLHQELERALCINLGVPEIALFSNGTIALLTALQALNLTGEVITTPFSFVATSHALLWNNLTPVFVDVDPDTLNLDPTRIECAITAKTTAILAVHCYGHPCDVHAIEAIASRHRLSVIYDAAHAFGVQMPDQSLLKYGDLSVLSFHATKVYNTFEGGAIVCPNVQLKEKVNRLKNFGHDGEERVTATGINGKMSELHAAIGLLQLKSVDSLIESRERIDRRYRHRLSDIPGLRCLNQCGQRTHNYAYFPILMDDRFPVSRDELYQILKAQHIHPRKYFFPLISSFPMYRSFPSAAAENLPAATLVAQQVLCLPIYPDLELTIVDRICEIIHNVGLETNHHTAG